MLGEASPLICIIKIALTKEQIIHYNTQTKPVIQTWLIFNILRSLTFGTAVVDQNDFVQMLSRRSIDHTQNRPQQCTEDLVIEINDNTRGGEHCRVRYIAASVEKP